MKQDHLKLHLTGGNSKSCLKRSEKFLRQSEKNLDYIMYYVDEIFNHDEIEYKSTLDLLSAELFPQNKVYCLMYYEGTGPRMIKRYSTEKIYEIDMILLIYMKLAKKHQLEGTDDSVLKQALRTLKAEYEDLVSIS